MDNIEEWKKIMLTFRDINMRMFRFMSLPFSRLGLSHSQAMALMILSKAKKLTVTELSRDMNMPPSNISGIAKRLEASGYLSRIRNEEDQRIVHLTLTPKAFEIAKQAQADFSDLLTRFSCLSSEEDKQVIADGMKRLKNIFDRIGESAKQEE